MNKIYISKLTELRPIILEKSEKYNLAPDLIAAIVIVESSCNPYAIRVEPGFWRRYNKAYKRIIKESHPARRWLKYPDVFAASYGLMQIMYGVAVENGFRGKFPTELLDPEKNIEFGVKILSRKIKRTGSIDSGVLAYNGGGNPNYPSKVFGTQRKVLSANIF